MDRLCVFLSTGFGIGSLTHAAVHGTGLRRFVLRKVYTGSGFLGTLEALILVALGLRFEGWMGGAALVALTLLAVPLAGRAERALGRTDDSRIVIDEVVGYFWSVAFLPLSGSPGRFYLLLAAAFILFRVFDVLKIPSRKAQELPGGWGILADDVLSGMAVNLVLQAATRVMP